MSILTELTKKLWMEYFMGDEGAVRDLLEMFQENSVIIGTGQHEFHRNLQEFQRALVSDFSDRDSIAYQITDLECCELEVSEDSSLVYGSVAIRWENEKATVGFNMDSRFSVLYKNIGGSWKVLHVHQSMPNVEQLPGEAYPKTLVSQMETAHEMIETLTQLAETDSLTGLINSRTLKERYAELDKKNTWLYAVDIDDFKQINDRQGHLQGNDTLVALSEFLTSTVRQNDLVCRMGGDEFVLLCTGIKSEKGAMKLAERLLINIQNISISVGMTPLEEGEPFDQAFERADSALYEAKRCGKGQASVKYPKRQRPFPSETPAHI